MGEDLLMAEVAIGLVEHATEAAAGRHAEQVVHFFDLMRDRLLRYLLGLRLPVEDAEEIVQEVFLALFEHLRRERKCRNARAWVFRVAHNLALKRRGRDRRNRQNLSSRAGDAASAAPDPEQQFLRSQRGMRFSAIWRALPEQERRCLALRAEGLTYREIAEVLDVSLGTVAASLGRSLARFARADGR